jgi:hypothetical protein
MMEGFHPQNAAALYMDGPFMADGMYRLGSWECSGPFHDQDALQCKDIVMEFYFFSLPFLLILKGSI